MTDLSGRPGSAVGSLPGRPPAVLAAWLDAVAVRGDGLDGLRGQLAAHAVEGLAVALGGREPITGADPSHSPGTIKVAPTHGGEAR